MAITFDSSAPGPEGAAGSEDALREGEGRPVALTLLPSHRSTLDDETVRLSIRLVEGSGIVARLATWKETERRGPGGRPETFPTRALLVGLTACALTDQPLHLTRVTEILFVQLGATWRGQLGLPEPPAADDHQAWAALYRNVRTRFHGMLALVDPSPTPKNRRLDDDTFNRLTTDHRAERTEEEWAERDDRLDRLINALIEASIKLLPRDVRRAYRGSVGVDGTLVRGHSRPYVRKRGTKTKKGRKPEIELHSVDPDAGFYVRQADERDAGVDTTTGRDKIAWGYEATFAVLRCGDTGRRGCVPECHPCHDRARPTGALRRAPQRPSPPPAWLPGLSRWFLADQALSSAKAEEFQLPALALGYRPVYDYKIDQFRRPGRGRWVPPDRRRLYDLSPECSRGHLGYRHNLIDENT